MHEITEVRGTLMPATMKCVSRWLVVLAFVPAAIGGAQASPDTTGQNRVLAAPWCDSVLVTDTLTPGGRRIPIRACTATPAESLALGRALTTMSHALTLYSRLTGVPYPSPRYDMRVKPAQASNMGGYSEHAGMVYQGVLPDPIAERDRPDVTAKILVHELAHQWFSDYVRNVGRSGWLSEGFSDFMAAQVWSVTHGPQGAEEFLFFYNTGWSSTPVPQSTGQTSRLAGEYAPYGWSSIPWPGATLWDGTLDRDDDLYYRGALVLWMLQQHLGDARFWASVRAYLRTHAHGVADSHDFQQAIQTATGENLDWFFTQWVYGTGYPRITVAATYEAATHRVLLRVTQLAPSFRMPVTIRVGTARGEVLMRTMLEGSDQTIVIEQVRQPPSFIVFDDRDAIVKTMQFEQPTAWLVAQLRREARPWQTWWAIEQLRQRVTRDRVAVAALMKAGRSGRHALTRAQALVALGTVAPAARHAAMPILTHGVRDTAVIVRRAAIQGLEAMGIPAAQKIVRSVFARDPSALVRADAIQSLLLSPAMPLAERHVLFAEALRQRGYRNVIPLVAIKAMAAATCDPSTMTILRSALDRTDMAAILREAIPLLAFATPTCGARFAELLK